jgi:hypothetical protein
MALNIEKSADELDMAADIAAQSLSEILEHHRMTIKPEQEKLPCGSWSVIHCVDCGEFLGARLELGKIRCVDCQSELEVKRSRRL